MRRRTRPLPLSSLSTPLICCVFSLQYAIEVQAQTAAIPSPSPSQPSKPKLPSDFFWPPSLVIMPTSAPTAPTSSPSNSPIPSTLLTSAPVAPTISPSVSLRPSESDAPTKSPRPTITASPTNFPSRTPGPSVTPPSYHPTRTPSPSTFPSAIPTHIPTTTPSEAPTSSFSPSTSPLPSYRPSHPPSEVPTDTPRPSPSPSLLPTNVPSSSPEPSFLPSLSLRPSRTLMPSARPTTAPSTGAPSVQPSSFAPSEFPTTGAPSAAPTSIPSVMPSGAPTVTMELTGRSLIEMRFAGLPELYNETFAEIWQEVTSTHVQNYWNSRPLAGVTVGMVLTEFIGQQDLSEQAVRKLQIMPNAATTAIYYDQRINYGYLGEDSRIKGRQDALFIEPFVFDQAKYTAELSMALLAESDIIVTSVEILSNGTISPTMMEWVDTVSPSPTPVMRPNRSFNTAVVASVVVVIILLLLGGFFAAFYYTRHRRHDSEWTVSDHKAPVMEIDYDENNIPIVSPGLGASNMTADEESDLEQYSDLTTGTNEVGTGTARGSAFDAAPPLPMPPPPQEEEQPENAPPSLLGGFDEDESEGEELEGNSSPPPDEDYAEEEVEEPPAYLMAPPDDEHLLGTYGSGPEGPSLSAFNVHVMDIDDDPDEEIYE